jgi:thiol-disulfide isomerase/thioredoxin
MARRSRSRAARRVTSGGGAGSLSSRRAAIAAGGVTTLVVAAIGWTALGDSAAAGDTAVAPRTTTAELFATTPVPAPSAAERAALAARGTELIEPSAERPMAPPMRLQTASYGDGSIFDVAEENGNVVVFYFMAAWCITCIPETQALALIDENYADAGVRVVILDVDQTENEDILARFREDYGNGQHLWAMDRDLGAARALGVNILDATVIVDREGRIAYRDGVPTSYETLAAIIEALS